MTADFDTGQRFGAYQLGKLVGRGGMGVVYQAQHVHLGRTVALKLLAPELSQNEDFRARFLRESRLAATLDHPGVVPVYDAGEVNGVLFIAMRFVRGTDLAALLDQRAPLASLETLEILDQVAEALDAAHAAGLVHRDVKPANVMIEGRRCYLADFGLTKRTSSDSLQLTAAGQFLGTVDYVAPEQIEGRDVDGRADVYALGCVLYECLTGSRPYPRDTQVAVLYAQLRDPPPRLTDLRSDLPQGVDTVMERAMAKAPAMRYASCRELVDAARVALGSAAPTLETPPPTAPVAPSAPAQPPTASLPPSTAGQLPTAPLPHSTVAPAPPATPPPATPQRRRGVPLLPLAFVAALALVGVAIALAVSGGGGDSDRASQGTPGPSEIAGQPEQPQPTSGPRPVGEPIAVGESPYGVVSKDGYMWVANNGDGTVTRVGIDGGSAQEIAVGEGPFDLASNADAVWAANSESDTVTRIDLGTGQADPPIPVGDSPFFLTAQDKEVYVSNGGDDTVTALDARGGAPIGEPIAVGSEPRGITSGFGSTWVANSGDGSVTRIDDGQAVGNIQVGSGPVGIAHSDDALWVTNEDSDTVSRIASDGSRVKTFDVGDAPYGVAFGEGYMWVTNSGDDTVMRLDAQSGEQVGEPIAVPGRPVSVSVAEGYVWVTSADAGTLTRIQP